MPYALNFHRNEDYLQVAVSGTVVGFDEVYAEAHAILREAEEVGLLSILLDMRQAGLRIDTHDAMMLAERMDQVLVQTRGLRVASIHGPHDEGMGRILETCFRNRSINYRHFSTEEPALEWLLVNRHIPEQGTSAEGAVQGDA